MPRGQSFRKCWHQNLTPHDASERGLYLIFRGGLPVLAPHYRPFDRRREAGVEAAVARALPEQRTSGGVTPCDGRNFLAQLCRERTGGVTAV